MNEENADIKDQNIESCGSSKHSEPETDEVDGDDEDEDLASEKTNANHVTETIDVKPPKIKKVIIKIITVSTVVIITLLSNRKSDWSGIVKTAVVLLSKSKKMLTSPLCQKALKSNLSPRYR